MTRSLRRTAAVLLTGVLIAVLSACGARIDTVLDIADDGSGTRQMTLTLSNSDRDEYVTGGNAALDASIRNHLPSELAYAGLTQDDENVTAVFTLDFSSVDDYRKKVSAILFAAGETDVPEIDIRVEDTLFSQGFSVDESFRSSDLLAWLEPGLLADGVIATDSQGNVTESGATTLRIRGQTFDEYQPIKHSAMIDLGMESVSMQTRLDGATSIERVIAYSMPTAAYKTHPDKIDAFLADATPDGATLAAGPATAGSTTWTMTITTDPSDLAEATSQALGGADVTFSLSEGLGTADPRVTLKVSGSAQCGTLCSPDAEPVTDTLIVPPSWSAASDDLVYQGEHHDDGWHYELGDTYDAGFERPLGITAATISTDLDLDLDGRVTQQIDLHLDGATDEAVGAALETYLSDRSLLSVEVDRSDTDDVIYTVAAGPGESTAVAGAFAEAGITGLWAEVTPTKDDGFFKHDLGIVVATPFSDAESTLVWGTPEVTHVVKAGGVTLSDGQHSGDELQVSGPVATLHGTGWTTAGVIGLVAIVVVAAAAVVVGVLQRRRIGALLGKGRAALASGRDAAHAHAAAALTEVTAPGATSGAPSPTTSVATAPWSEADLR